MDIEVVAGMIVDAAIKVHRTLGPGLLESAYQECLAYELRKRGLQVDCEVALPVDYDGIDIDTGYRLDMLIEDMIIIENITDDDLSAIHEAQLLTYLKLRDCHLGFLLQWNSVLMKNGIKRIANDPPESSPGSVIRKQKKSHPFARFASMQSIKTTYSILRRLL